MTNENKFAYARPETVARTVHGTPAPQMAENYFYLVDAVIWRGCFHSTMPAFARVNWGRSSAVDAAREASMGGRTVGIGERRDNQDRGVFAWYCNGVQV